jgi:hypothetical protein
VKVTNVKEALVVYYKLLCSDITSIGNIESYNDYDSQSKKQSVDTIQEYNLFLDLDKLFKMLSENDQKLILAYMRYENKKNAAKSLQIPMMTFHRHLKSAINKFNNILKKHAYYE